MLECKRHKLCKKKWNSIRETIVEVGYDIFCFQETKRETFDSQFIKKFGPPWFNAFFFLLSVGASGGLITC